MANNAIIEKWVQALESGDYEQGTGYLAQRYEGDDPTQFCCLGVLCDLAVKEAVIVEPFIRAHDENFDENEQPNRYVFEYGGLSGILPDPVADWAGIADDPSIDVDDADIDDDMDNHLPLTTMNDMYAMDFPTIAKHIRKYYLGENNEA